MTSQCGSRRPNLNETKMRRRYDVACRVGTIYLICLFHYHLLIAVANRNQTEYF